MALASIVLTTAKIEILSRQRPMCGIAGQFNFKTNQPVERETIERMADTITHRGPDDSGIHVDGGLGLGFRRLSIIDLSSAGHQPMCDPDQRAWIIFNGEIYNFRELRKELLELGHSFKGGSDTEVILHGYLEWGDSILNRLNGMFGLAIWDVSKRRLIVARDPMGIKPVYYHVSNGSLLFGSEIRPILAVLPTKPNVDPVAFNLFLRYRYTPAPYTIHEGIKKLAPGEALYVENGNLKRRRYYDFTPKRFSPPLTDDEAKERLLQLYKDAMERHLVSDVPVGLLLSGGVDSGMLLSLMNLYGKNWPTFTVGYGSSFKDDELDDAAETAKLLGSNHHTVHIDRKRFESELPRIVSILEEPIASSSIVPMYFVSERARQDVTVALIGQGPDELFGGYNRHLGVAHGEKWRRLPSFVRSAAGAAISALPRQETLKRGIQSLDQSDRLARYRDVFSLMPGSQVDALFQDGLVSRDPGQVVLDCWSELEPQMEHLDELGGFQMLEIRSSLPDELLMYADKLSMTHSLELRVPFLDREVVEFSQQLDASMKVRGRQRKWLHKEVCGSYLPREIVNRKKRGFAVNVVDDWFKSEEQGKHADFLGDSKSLIFNYLDHSEVGKLRKAHESGRQDNHKLLFSLIVMEEWMRYMKIGN
ncbi:asparagine synthase (glutamine-hydrolyzing) [Pelagicoccus sp. SDUM812003]|uniref:asparagine synthase (glutamine-hydrolyzing) n=1 Tax=Pelagicoccus sp. SDUM812003 TaxID=3041267 RepID=UPI00281213FB|nr:asparagine synthase (glutamine-hydrolyzing) [Pelagicoccus sp. SDUM812003]